MSELSTPEQRTEMPTAKRMGQLRKEGQLHFSQDLVTVVSLFTGFTVVSMVATSLFSNMKLVLIKSFGLIAETKSLSYQTVEGGAFYLLRLLGPDVITIVAVTALAASLALMIQTDWNVKEKKFKFDFNLINPLAGLKRIVSIHGFINTLKAMAKLALILPIGYFALRGFAPQMVQLIHVTTSGVLAYMFKAVAQVYWQIFYFLLALAIIDYFYGKWRWLRLNKMTKEEVKDERKAVEGDEETKRKIQAKGLQRIIQRIKSSVPKADVVVTNPTHYAVALKYERNSMAAPKVVAKGKGFVAERIKAIARAAGVPVLERKALARALFSSVEVGMLIPRELFRAVAEVLAYVYRLKNPYWQGAAPNIPDR